MAAARDERDAARAALTQLQYEREAAARPEVLDALPLPAYLRLAKAKPSAFEPLQPAERVYHCGNGLNDVLGLSGSAADVGAAPVYMPGDRLATVTVFPSPADGNTKEAELQRRMHKQTEILQGVHVGQKD